MGEPFLMKFRETLTRLIFSDADPPYCSAKERVAYYRRPNVHPLAREAWELGNLYRTVGSLTPEQQKRFEEIAAAPGAWERWLANPPPRGQEGPHKYPQSVMYMSEAMMTDLLAWDEVSNG